MPADDPHDAASSILTRRRFLAWSAASALIAACELAGPTEPPENATRAPAPPTPAGPSATPGPIASAPASTPTPSGSPATVLAGRTLYRDGALADARSDQLRIGVSILVEDGTIRWTGDPMTRAIQARSAASRWSMRAAPHSSRAWSMRTAT